MQRCRLSIWIKDPAALGDGKEVLAERFVYEIRQATQPGELGLVCQQHGLHRWVCHWLEAMHGGAVEREQFPIELICDFTGGLRWRIVAEVLAEYEEG